MADKLNAPDVNAKVSVKIPTALPANVTKFINARYGAPSSALSRADYIQSAPNQPITPVVADGGLPISAEAIAPAPKGPEYNLGQSVVEGGLGAVGYAFRVITGIGRAAMTASDRGFSHQDEVMAAIEDQDVGKVALEYGSSIVDMAVGFGQGLANSVIPGFDEMIDPVDKRPLPESYTDIFRSEEFKRNNNWLDDTPYWDGLLGKWTPLNTVGTTLDIVLDPASFATLGIGGAVKGLSRGVSTATKYAKSGGNAAEVLKNVQNLPRPFYEPLKKVEGKKLRKRVENAVPLPAPKYTIGNTNPALYILKEMGRGFKEAHLQAEARLAAKTTLFGFRTGLAKKLGENLNDTDFLEEDILRIGKDYTDEILATRKAELEAKNLPQEVVDDILSSQSKDLDDIARSFADPKVAAKFKAVLGKTSQAAIAQEAADLGITPVERAVQRAADEVAKSFPGRAPVYRVSRPDVEVRAAKPVAMLGIALQNAARGAKGSDEAVKKVWDDFIKNPENREFLQFLDEATSQPIGFRASRAKKTDDAVEGAPSGKKVNPRTLLGIDKKPSGEEAVFLERFQKDLQKNSASKVWGPDNLANDWQRLREIRGDKNFNIDEALPADSLTADSLIDAGISLSLLAARITYRAGILGGAGSARYTIERIGESGFNPLKSSVESIRSFNMPSTDLEAKAAAAAKREVTPMQKGEIYSLMLAAAGSIRDKSVLNILGRIGLPKEALEVVDSARGVDIDKISEALSQVSAQKFTKARQLLSAEADKKTITLDINGKKTVITSKNITKLNDDKIIELMDIALKRNKLRTELVSPADIKKASDYLEQLNAKKIKALIDLDALGLSPNGDAAAIFAAVTRTRSSRMGQLSRSALPKVFAHVEAKSADRQRSEFIAYAYSASRHQYSLEGGRFADHIDMLAQRAGIPLLSTIRKKSEQAAAIVELSKDEAWTEFVTPALLHSVETNTRNIGRQTGNKLSNKVILANEERLIKEAEALYADLLEDVAARKVKLDGWMSGKVLMPQKTYNERLMGGNSVRASDLINPDFPEAVKAAEKALGNTILALDEITRGLVAQLGESLQKTLGGLKRGEKVFVPASGTEVSHVDVARLIQAVKAIPKPKPGKSKEPQQVVAENLIRRVRESNYDRAVNAAARADAKKEAARSLPLSVDLKSLTAFIKQEIRVSETSIERVGANLHARFWHATDMSLAENVVDQALVRREAVARTVTQGELGIEKLSKRKENFEKIVKKLEDAIDADVVKHPVANWDGKASVDDVIANGNPRLFVSWIRNKEIMTSADKDQWATAMKHLINMTKVGRNSPYKSYKDVIDSYLPRKDSKLQPGQINPKTGKPVPTEEQIANILVSLGIKGADKLIKPDKVLGRKDVLEFLSKSRSQLRTFLIGDARTADFFSEIVVPNGDVIRKMMDDLPDDEVTVDQSYELLLTTVNQLKASGQSWIIDLAGAVGGTAVGRYVKGNFGWLGQKPIAKFLEEDILGRQYRSKYSKAKLEQMAAEGEIPENAAYKLNFDKENLYESEKLMFSTLSKIAEDKGFRNVADPRRQQFIAESAIMVLRLRDLWLNARGIYPSSTLTLYGKNELSTLIKATGQKLSNISEEGKRALGNYGSYVTMADIGEVLGPTLFKNMFAVGPMNSIPITSLYSPVRALMMAMHHRKGEWFSEEQARDLLYMMRELMFNDIKTITRGVDDKGNPIGSLVTDEKGLARVTQIIEDVVGVLAKPENAMELFKRHTANATFAFKRLRYDANKISKPIITNLQKMLESNMSGSGTNMQAVIDSAKELNDALGFEQVEPIVEALARLDLNAAIGAKMGPLEMILTKESTDGIVLGAEAKTLKEFQEGLAGSRLDSLKDSRDVIFEDSFAQKIDEAIEMGADDDLLYEIGLNETAGRHNKFSLNFWISAMNNTFKLFANHGMEYTRDALTAIALNTKNTTAQFAEDVTRHVVSIMPKYAADESATGRKVLVDAFKVIQQAPEESLVKALTAMSRLKNLTSEAGKPLAKKVTKREYADLIEDAKLLDDFIGPDDTLLKEAVADVWMFAKTIFGGGQRNLIGRSSNYNEVIMNRIIGELGAGNYREVMEEVVNEAGKKVLQPKRLSDGWKFQKRGNTEDFVNQWKEWDIQNPFDFLVGIHAALRRSEELQTSAASVIDTFGTAIDSITPARARELDLVTIKPLSFPSDGKELIYLLPRGYYIPRQIAAELQELAKFLTGVKHLEKTGPFGRFLLFFQPFQDFMKKASTTYTAKNWIQNTGGGFVWNAIAGGVASPLAYYRSLQILKAMGADVEKIGIDEAEALKAIDKFKVAPALKEFQVRPENDPTVNNSVVIRVGGKDVAISYDAIGKGYVMRAGAVPKTQAGGTDALREAGSSLGKIKRAGLGTRFDTKIAKVAAGRDDWLRVALFTSILQKSSWKTLDDGFKYAAKEVNRIHPQMQGLGYVAQKYLRQGILFYTWRAKTLGTVMMNLLDRPGPILIGLKAQYGIMQSQGAELEQFGDFDPAGLVPSYLRGNMDPTYIDEDGRLRTFTISNPATDLLGTGSWLSGIRFNGYDSPANQIGQSIGATWDRFAIASLPIAASLPLDYFNGKTMDGTPITQGGRWTKETMPVLVEDAFKRLGLGPEHQLAAMLFPQIAGQALRASNVGKTTDQVTKDTNLVILNWLTGLRIKERDTIENRNKGWQEYVATMTDLQQ
jgi:hypothetical protein